jgi:hypothetical protein
MTLDVAYSIFGHCARADPSSLVLLDNYSCQKITPSHPKDRYSTHICQALRLACILGTGSTHPRAFSQSLSLNIRTASFYKALASLQMPVQYILSTLPSLKRLTPPLLISVISHVLKREDAITIPVLGLSLFLQRQTGLEELISTFPDLEDPLFSLDFSSLALEN